MEGSGRTSLNFSRKAILTTSEGGYAHDTEKEVKPSEAEVASQNVFQSDLNKLASRGNVSLYDQLQSNKEAQEEEWKAKNNMFMPPKAMDAEEAAFIQEQDEERKQAQARHDAKVENELAAFAIAKANKTVLRKVKTETKSVQKQKQVAKPANPLIGGSVRMVKLKRKSAQDDKLETSSPEKTRNSSTPTQQKNSECNTGKQVSEDSSKKVKLQHSSTNTSTCTGLLALGAYGSDSDSE